MSDKNVVRVRLEAWMQALYREHIASGVDPAAAASLVLVEAMTMTIAISTAILKRGMNPEAAP